MGSRDGVDFFSGEDAVYAEGARLGIIAGPPTPTASNGTSNGKRRKQDEYVGDFEGDEEEEEEEEVSTWRPKKSGERRISLKKAVVASEDEEGEEGEEEEDDSSDASSDADASFDASSASFVAPPVVLKRAKAIFREFIALKRASKSKVSFESKLYNPIWTLLTKQQKEKRLKWQWVKSNLPLGESYWYGTPNFKVRRGRAGARGGGG